MIGTNRDPMVIQRLLDSEITAICELSDNTSRFRWVSGRLLTLQQARIAICATRVNRRIEAAKPVVDLACWFNGNSALKAIEHAARRSTTESWISDERARRPIG